MKGLTDRQQEVLDYITRTTRERGYPPTIREIGADLGIRSTNGVNDHLKALERKGFIERSTAKSRAINVVDVDRAGSDGADGGEVVDLDAHRRGSLSDRRSRPAPVERSLPTVDMVSIPLLGRIAAGQPIAAFEDADDFVHVDASLLRHARGADVFALRVQGDSMIEDGVFDGDIIFVRRQPDAERGAMVAAMIDDAVTVKRYYREGVRVRLEPANAAMSAIVVSADEARETVVLGLVIGLYRQVV